RESRGGGEYGSPVKASPGERVTRRSCQGHQPAAPVDLEWCRRRAPDRRREDSMTNDDSLPTSGMLDARYEILECVGQGGMARVYRAKDTLLGRVVAIKLLRGELDGDDASAGRARGEMTALASLNHPALVTLYDAQLQPGRPEYLVMEFVDGPTLAARIAQGPLAPSDVAALTADLAEALHVV